MNKPLNYHDLEAKFRDEIDDLTQRNKVLEE